MYLSSTDLKKQYGISDKKILDELITDGARTIKIGKHIKYNINDIINIFENRRQEVLKNFNSNKKYSNKFISEVFKANVQRGMKKTNYFHSLVLLETNSGRAEYNDFWVNDILHYTGMGVEGNQDLERENKTLALSNKFNLAIFLFESKENDSLYKFVGRMVLCNAPYIHEEIDLKGIKRKVYKFPLSKKENIEINDNIIDNDIEIETINEFISFSEGKKIEYFTTKYERNPKLRKLAIQIHGTKCMACGFDFEKNYGPIGKNYIEVHHNKPLHLINEEIEVNPVTDLVCLCSNCHRIVHRKKYKVLSFESLKNLIKEYQQEMQ